MMQSQKDVENINRLYASVKNLQVLSAADSKALSAVVDRAESAEAAYGALRNQLDEVAERLTQLTAVIDETYNEQELRKKALTLLIEKLQKE
jgi:hypothetical protein